MTRTRNHTTPPPAASATTSDAQPPDGADPPAGLFVVSVRDQRAVALAGSPGAAYVSPPHTLQHAIALACLLADGPLTGPGPWRLAIAGGQRTISLEPLTR